MHRSIIISVVIIVILSACSTLPPVSATETPVPTQTKTLTPTPTLTPSPTPTLEPWMQALPENITSVSTSNDAILGLDEQNNPIMEFDLEKKQWIKIIDDIPSYVIERTQFYEEKYALSWVELVNELVYENEQFRDWINNRGKYNELAVFSFRSVGYVLGVSTLPVKNENWQNMGISEEVVLEVALPGSEQLGLMLCGVVQNGNYKSFCGPIESQGKNPSKAELEDLYVGLFFGGTFVDYYVGTEKQINDLWAKLENGDFSEDSQESWIQEVTVLRMGDSWDLWKELVFDPGGPIVNNYEFMLKHRQAERNGDVIKPAVADVSTMGAYHLWAYRESNYANPVLIPVWFGRLYIYD